MDGTDSSRPHFSPHEATLDVPSPVDASPVAACHPHVALVEGSGSGVSGEMRCVLQTRLRVAALVLLAGFAVFLVWFAFTRDFSQPYAKELFAAHVVVTLLLASASGLMLRRCVMSLGQLRVKELLIFGAPALYFSIMQYFGSMNCVVDRGYVPNPSGPWLILIYTYAVFIPNSWQRAAVVTTTMALVPVAILLVLWRTHTGCGAWLRNEMTFIVETALIMAVAALGAPVGVYTIGRLRREAYEARQLGQYRLKRLLGSGGMGEVYLAEHQLMKRPCAVKVIRPEKAGDPRVLARFEREVRATAKLSHWNSIDIYDYGRTDDGTFYYAMEYLPGMNLHELVQRWGPLPAERVIHLLRQTCDALEEAHLMGLVHRDIKPANIFAARRGGRYDVAKLLDFGLAKPLPGGDEDSVQLTQEGSITGSPLYLSPEQATGESEPDARSDIYSVGVVMYYLLTGHPPFDSEKPIRVIIAHAQQDPVAPRQVVREIPQDLEEVVLRCLAKRPEDRFQSPAELAEALDDCQAAGEWDFESAERWWRAHPAETSEPTEQVLV